MAEKREWPKVPVRDVVHPQMFAEMEALAKEGNLTAGEIWKMCEQDEYAKYMESKGLLPAYAKYALVYALGLWGHQR